MQTLIEEFESILFKECEPALRRMLHGLRGQGLYSMALYTSDDLGYLFPTCSTASGLAESVARYRSKPLFSHYSVEDLQAVLKWSPCDSPHHLAFRSALPGAEQKLRQFMELQDRLWEAGTRESEAEWEDNMRQIWHGTMRVLKRLDQAGVFGISAMRQGIVVNFLRGDQSDSERTTSATILNPRAIAEMYARELSEHAAIWRARHS